MFKEALCRKGAGEVQCDAADADATTVEPLELLW